MIIGRYLEDGSIVRASDGATVPPGHRWHDELLALEQGGGVIEEWEPAPEPVREVTRRQILTGLAVVGWISEQEAIDALATGARPAAVDAVIDQLPEGERFNARMKWIGFQTAYRDDPMVAALAAIEGKTEQEVDDFFALCAGIA